MKALWLLSALVIILALVQPLAAFAEDDIIVTEISAPADDGLGADITNSEPVRVPQSWNMALWGFVVGVLIISLAAKGRSKPPVE